MVDDVVTRCVCVLRKCVSVLRDVTVLAEVSSGAESTGLQSVKQASMTVGACLRSRWPALTVSKGPRSFPDVAQVLTAS